MIATYGLSCIVAQRSLASAAGAAFPEDVSDRLTSYSQSVVARGGYESAGLSFVAEDLEEALTWADRLFCPITCVGPEMEVAWDGHIAQVELQLGGRVRSLSLETVFNRVRCRYTSLLGTAAVTATASNAASIALYGTRDGRVSASGVTAAYAEGLRDSTLGRYALPRARPSTTVRVGAADSGEITIGLQCAGWYATLGQVMLERVDQSSEATTAQVAALIGSSSPGIGAVNAFLSPSAALIATTGVSMTRKIEADTTYQAAIEKRLAAGDATGQRYAWGVFDTDRRLTVRQWAGASPSVIGYRTWIGDAVVETGAGVAVPPWLVRPDAMVEDVDLLVVGPPSGASDTASRYYLERVSLQIDAGGMALTLEPEASSDLDARIARYS